MEATKDNNPFQFEGMTPNIWIEKNLRELLKASQTGTILEDIPSLMYTSNKLVPGVIDTIPSDNNTRGHTFSQDLDWLSCGERWQCLRLLIWHIGSCMLCPAGANGMRSDQWQNKQRSHFFQDLDWLSCGEWWQSPHLLIWHVRSCMLCSASSKF